MGRWAPKYSQAQREAAYRLVHVERMSAREAAQALARGVYDAEPVEIRDTYVRVLANDIRDKRAGVATSVLGQQAPETVAQALFARGTSIIDEELAAIEKTKKGKRDLNRLKALYSAQSAITAATKPSQAKPPNTPAPTPTPTGPSLMDALREDYEDKALGTAPVAPEPELPSPTSPQSVAGTHGTAHTQHSQHSTASTAHSANSAGG